MPKAGHPQLRSNRKSGPGTSPHASGSPWKYVREQLIDKDYSADYTRKASTSRSGVSVSLRPCAHRSVPHKKTDVGLRSGRRFDRRHTQDCGAARSWVLSRTEQGPRRRHAARSRKPKATRECAGGGDQPIRSIPCPAEIWCQAPELLSADHLRQIRSPVRNWCLTRCRSESRCP